MNRLLEIDSDCPEYSDDLHPWGHHDDETCNLQAWHATHPKIYIGTIEGYPLEEVRTAVGRLNELAIAGEQKGLRDYLTELLPGAQLSG